MQESHKIAETILKAEMVANYVRQIDALDFVIKKDENEIRIKTYKEVLESPVILLKDKEILDELKNEIGVSFVCSILNKHLENAKIEIMDKVHKSTLSSREVIRGEEPDILDGWEKV